MKGAKTAYFKKYVFHSAYFAPEFSSPSQKEAIRAHIRLRYDLALWSQVS